jgi:protein-S-isoprenylcysteine O-methyltransferase Ste14
MPFPALELKLPPVLVTVLFALSMWLLSRATPDLMMPEPLVIAAFVICWVAGAAIALAGVVSFRRARTTVNPLDPQNATTLVVSGVFRITRNPMYLGLLLGLLGWGICLSNAFSLVLVMFFVPYMNRFQILPEERALERVFGGSFRSYKARVRRWI